MSPRLLFLLNARNAPRWRRAHGAPRGIDGLDWIDAQAAAARMPGRARVATVVTLPRRIARPAYVPTAQAA